MSRLNKYLEANKQDSIAKYKIKPVPKNKIEKLKQDFINNIDNLTLELHSECEELVSEYQKDPEWSQSAAADLYSEICKAAKVGER